MSVVPELFELAAKHSGRSDGRFLEGLYGRSWLIAVFTSIGSPLVPQEHRGG